MIERQTSCSLSLSLSLSISLSSSSLSLFLSLSLSHPLSLMQAVHTLVADPTEDLDSWLELVTLCRKENMFSLCENLLRQLGGTIPTKTSLSNTSLRSYSKDSQHTPHALPIMTNSTNNNGATNNTNSTNNNNNNGTNSNLVNYSFSMPNLHAALSSNMPLNAALQNKVNPRVVLATHKYWWCSGEKVKALNGLTEYISSLEPHSSYLASLAEKNTRETMHGTSTKIDTTSALNLFSGNRIFFFFFVFIFIFILFTFLFFFHMAVFFSPHLLVDFLSYFLYILFFLPSGYSMIRLFFLALISYCCTYEFILFIFIFMVSIIFASCFYHN